jgi:hypothetical protein
MNLDLTDAEAEALNPRACRHLSTEDALKGEAMADQTPCAICVNQAEYELVPPRVTWRCSRCGAFSYDSSEGPPRIRSPDEMVRLSGWVREQNAAGVVPVHITPEITRRVAQMPMPGLRERASRVLVNWQETGRTPCSAEPPLRTI